MQTPCLLSLKLHAKLPEILWDMNHGGCSFAEFNLFHNTGFKSVILGIYYFLDNVRYWAGLAELCLSIRLHLQFSCDSLHSTKAGLEDIRVALDCDVPLCLEILWKAWV